ncbi:hypothetical protein NDI44_11150 [Trichocoleus sp. DQ-A3]|uniref:hypothetical protein n=1 Tax=Cyanophyceae TaxID=3028117 RepID=UPI001681CA65|nr:hypothetical protein [Coleofasciculus sp. FACHB-125]MBD1902651.1 hypothetical protein [Coleofasciculus sp. FACHB-125]
MHNLLRQIGVVIPHARRRIDILRSQLGDRNPWGSARAFRGTGTPSESASRYFQGNACKKSERQTVLAIPASSSSIA